MVQQFLNHIKKYRLFEANQRILLTVSGGLDSMVMLHLFKQTEFQVGVAHCNFNLRGSESDGDEQLVKEASDGYGFPFFTIRFATSEYAAQHGVSIQMAARELRYDWFEKIRTQHHYDFIATAHHINDTLETIILNLVRGTGIDGLAGIPIKNQKLIRPLLFASRSNIEQYAKAHHLIWREDASNADDHYQRNLIRHQIIPLLNTINPNLEEGFMSTVERLNGGKTFNKYFIDIFLKEAIDQREDRLLIKRDVLSTIKYPQVMLWEMIKDYGFHYHQCCEIIEAEHQSGSIFLSKTHEATIDRQFIIVTKKEIANIVHVFINEGTSIICEGNLKLVLEKRTNQNFIINRDKTVAQLDADKLQYPLLWRTWSQGDHFVPLGMRKHKKISDLLVDEKVALPDKRGVTVIESAGEIVWVMGIRIADSYKVTPDTKNILIINKL